MFFKQICDWENKYNEQCELTNEIITQYNSLKLNENTIKTKLKEMKELKDCIYAELCSYKVSKYTPSFFFFF